MENREDYDDINDEFTEREQNELDQQVAGLIRILGYERTPAQMREIIEMAAMVFDRDLRHTYHEFIAFYVETTR